ncbi:MAG: glutathione S-transferase [Nostocaceae cyanobacterium CSU_2_110]|nr:glutathione S-transferase [Richelia sp. SM1_7_0]NJS15979.1 glutathione S-transferase [Nostocaceae cyanobacterium CSU_2_110]
MKLFYTPNSPYARVARVTALELNLGDRIKMEKVIVRDPNSILLNYNPTGKVPTLETDDKFILSETRIICAYLERLNNIRLFADISDIFSLQLEGIVGGFLDGVAVWVREARRLQTEQSSSIIELERSRALRCLSHFEQLSDTLEQQPKFSHILLGCSLGIMEARFHDFQWRQEHLQLANWYDQFSRRSSMQATVPEV